MIISRLRLTTHDRQRVLARRPSLAVRYENAGSEQQPPIKKRLSVSYITKNEMIVLLIVADFGTPGMLLAFPKFTPFHDSPSVG